MKPIPPARYRIEERGRRLIVIDQWAGDVQVTASLPTTADVVAPHTAANAFAASSLSASADSQRAAAGSSVRKTAASASVAGARPSGNAAARALLKLQSGPGGSAILTTTRLYDSRSPRRVVLQPTQLQKVNGMLVLMLVGLVFVLFIGMLTSPFLLLFPVVLLFNAGKGFRKSLSEKIDQLEPA